MNKGSKPRLVVLLLSIVMIALVILAYVGIKLKCEELVKIKVISEENLKAMRNKKVNLLADYQNYAAEERVVAIALDELKMVRRSSPGIQLTVSKEKIEQISELIKEKYD
jgi:Tfp pilus assembly protein PilO